MTDYKLLEWVDETKLTTIRLSHNKNPNAFNIIKKRILNYSTSEDWYYICQSKIARDYLTKNLHKVCDIDSLPYNDEYGYILRYNQSLNIDFKYNNINWKHLSSKDDDNAIYILSNNIDKIDWFELSSNSKALYLLQQHKDKIHHEQLWLNKNINKVYLIDLTKCIRLCSKEFLDMVNKNNELYNLFIIKNLDTIISKMSYKISITAYKSFDIKHLDENGLIWQNINNKRIIRKLLETYKNIRCSKLSNRSEMLDIIMEYPHIIDWNELSKNSLAIFTLCSNIEKINWSNLSLNTAAIELLKQNLDKIDWINLCKNENAYNILIENQDKIHWNTLIYIKNPIFKDLLYSNIELIDEEHIMFSILQGCEWKIIMFMDYNFKNNYEDNDGIIEWIINASTKLEFDFIRRHFDENDYYDILGENPNIFY